MQCPALPCPAPHLSIVRRPSLPQVSDEFDAYIVVSFSNATLVLRWVHRPCWHIHTGHTGWP